MWRRQPAPRVWFSKVESSRVMPSATMIALDDDRLNRIGSVGINDGDDGGDGGGGSGGDVNEGAETKGADLTIALDGDDRIEERSKSIRI